MGFFKILLKRSVEKDLRKIDSSRVSRVVEAIRALAENPFPSGCKRLRGAKNFYRIRVGDYRIIYWVDVKEKIIIVYYVRHRRTAYRR
ncbi:MAG: type II toxin-antitoxin system RelE/ParE family toxin [Thermoprotei archaeon]|nr:MAG: type II toxin-antitoxin system RelE/ParE family toxin [Thermoprotei archaeon]